jgi:hypothetical protein
MAGFLTPLQWPVGAGAEVAGLVGGYRSLMSFWVGGALSPVQWTSEIALLFVVEFIPEGGSEWIPITADVLRAAPVSTTRGIEGSTPNDVVASPGPLQLTLNNAEDNSAETIGYYSPNHSNARAGWTYGVWIRVRYIYEGSSRTVWTGRVETILPDMGRWGTRRVTVTAFDIMQHLLEAPIRGAELQVAQTEDVLIEHLLDLLPVESQPPARSIAPGLDVYPYAFDTMEGDLRLLTALSKVARASQVWAFPLGDGTFTTRNRTQMLLSEVTFDLDQSMVDIVVPSSLEGVYNHVEVIAHPKHPHESTTDVLTPELTSPQALGAGVTLEIFVPYGDGIDTWGGMDFQAFTATTDYLLNSLADGSGTDLTASMVATAEPFASDVKMTFTNNSGQSGYITKRQLRGRILHNHDPIVAQSYSAKPYGVRKLTLDFELLSDANKAQQFADFFRSTRENLQNRIDEVSFLANRSPEHLRAALDVEIGDRISVTEPVTGLSMAYAYVRSVTLELDGEGALWCRWGLAPSGGAWGFVLDSPTMGRLDNANSLLGFA